MLREKTFLKTNEKLGRTGRTAKDIQYIVLAQLVKKTWTGGGWVMYVQYNVETNLLQFPKQ